MSLKTKFLLPTLVFFFLGLGTIIFISAWGARSTMEELQEHSALELSRSLAVNVSNWLISIKRDAVVWSTRPEFIEHNNFVTRNSLQKLRALSPLYAGISLIDNNGLVSFSTTQSNEGVLDLRDRDYFQDAMRGNVGISDLNFSKVTGLPVVAVAAPLSKDSVPLGAIYMTVNIRALSDYFFKDIPLGEYGYIMMCTREGIFLSHPNITEMNQKGEVPAYLRDMLAQKTGITLFTAENGKDYLAAFTTDEQLGWMVTVCYSLEEIYASINEIEFINLGIGGGVLLAAVIFIFILVRSITTPLHNTLDVISELAEGEGDLTVRLQSHSQDEIGRLTREVNLFIEKLWHLVSQIREDSLIITQHAVDMHRNNAEINGQTQQQAAAIESTSHDLEQMSASVHKNADRAREASQKADSAHKLTQQGGEMLSQTMISMNEVTESSQKINEIITVVNEIASQTNLLALNAAVEAARAGEAGKGFAVVAGEVRNLAGRSAQAAREIRELITDSVNKITNSNDLVLQSDNILKSIIDSIQQADEAIAYISSASQQQAEGIDSIHDSMRNLDTGIRHNTEMVNDNAVLSDELAAAARNLEQSVSKFKL
ncbi:MAG: methyl-accepting chemotaxis protein [Desulfarculales bacterium]|jgi:methyl-accepting chemotaxis protein|nr:methyl-accepting chemotaxis protein [Desulfarculales bacterium]